MAGFKFVISDPSTKKSFQKEVDQAKAISLSSKKIGEEFSGDIIDLQGYMLQITGGTDKDGFPMHPSVKGPGRKRVLLKGPPGFYPKIKGQRKRKTVRGDTISQDIVQVNVKVVKKGEKPLEELVPMKPKEKKETKQEKPAEAKKEEKPKEQPKKEEKKPTDQPKPEAVKKEIPESPKTEHPKEASKA